MVTRAAIADRVAALLRLRIRSLAESRSDFPQRLVRESRAMQGRVKVACVQAQPVVFERDATLDKLAALTAEAAREGAELVVFPETFVSVYPSSAWARALAAWGDPRAKAAFVMLAQSAVEVPGPASDRLGAIAREHDVWLVVGVNELDPRRSGTVYNALLYFGPDGSLALEHRKLVPTNHERLVWGQGDGGGLRALETSLGRIGGLICFENYMPLARFSLYESGIEVYLAPTADDDDEWQATLVHIARESRSFVVSPCHFQRASAYPFDFPLAELLEGRDLLGRGGSAILAPDGSYLAGPLYGEEGILYAELDPTRLQAERQRFDPAGHYHRPDVLRLTVTPISRADRADAEVDLS
jgi:nitrilase